MNNPHVTPMRKRIAFATAILFVVANVALLIDEYNEDWRKLYFIMIQGKASLIGGKKLEQNEQVLLEKAHKLLSGKYVQYQEIGIGEYVIMIVPQKVITWKNV